MAEDFETRKKNLEGEILPFKKVISGRAARMSFASNSLMLISILLSFSVTILSFLNEGVSAAILGLALTALLTVQKVWDFNQLSRFYKSILWSLEALQTAVRFTKNESDLEKEVAQLIKIKELVARGMPASGGLEEIYKLREELESGKQRTPV